MNTSMDACIWGVDGKVDVDLTWTYGCKCRGVEVGPVCTHVSGVCTERCVWALRGRVDVRVY